MQNVTKQNKTNKKKLKFDRIFARLALNDVLRVIRTIGIFIGEQHEELLRVGTIGQQTSCARLRICGSLFLSESNKRSIDWRVVNKKTSQACIHAHANMNLLVHALTFHIVNVELVVVATTKRHAQRFE